MPTSGTGAVAEKKRAGRPWGSNAKRKGIASYASLPDGLTAADTEDSVSVGVAAQMLGVNHKTMHKIIASGHVQAFAIPGVNTIRVPRRVIAECLQRGFELAPELARQRSSLSKEQKAAGSDDGDDAQE